MGEDSRGTLEDKQEELGLTDNEAKQIETSVGVVVCSNEDNPGNAQLGTGFIINNNMTIITAAHVLYVGGRLRQACWFVLQKNSKDRYLIDYDAIETGTDIPTLEKNKDFAVALLARPVPDGKPLSLYSPQYAVDDTFISVSGTHADRRFESSEQIVQQCTVLDQNDLPSQEYSSDCDMYAGGSGGPLLTRYNGRLVASAVTVSISTGGMDGRPYDYMTNFTVSLAYGKEMQTLIDGVTERLPPTTAGLIFADPLF